MSAPGPDGVVCEFQCDAWNVDPRCPQHGGAAKTRQRRIALDSMREYYVLSREHMDYDAPRATVLALQGILRGLIFMVEEELNDVQGS